MGQQQLLIILLSVIVVGVAIVVGSQIFSSQAVSHNRDALLNNMQHVAILVQKYYKTPTLMRGGGGSFTGVDSPGFIPSGLMQNGNGNINFTVTSDRVTISGIGIETSEGFPIEYTMIVTPTSIEDPVKIN